jgi:hypothetical protein
VQDGCRYQSRTIRQFRTVGNILAEFRRAGLLEITDRLLTVFDPPGLRGIAAEMN